VVGRLRALAQREQAPARAIVGLEPFGVDHPILPADVREVQRQSLHPTLICVGEHDCIARVRGL